MQFYVGDMNVDDATVRELFETPCFAVSGFASSFAADSNYLLKDVANSCEFAISYIEYSVLRYFLRTFAVSFTTFSTSPISNRRSSDLPGSFFS